MTSIAALIDRTARKERAAVVRWLRTQHEPQPGWLADMIERGEHLTPVTPTTQLSLYDDRTV